MIRPATLEDATQLAAIEVGAMLAGYAEFADELGGLPSIVEEVAAWRGVLRDAAARVWIAEDDGVALGLAAVSHNRLDELMVLPDRWGAGVGAALLQRAEADLAEHGSRRPTLWVYAANQRARDFYEQHGWILDADADRGVLGPQVQYRKEL